MVTCQHNVECPFAGCIRNLGKAMKLKPLMFNMPFIRLGRDVQKVKASMLRITTENKRGKISLFVEGRLAGSGVGTLEQCWRELSAASPKPKFLVDLCGVSYIDSTGKVLLKEMFQSGALLVAEGCLNQA